MELRTYLRVLFKYWWLVLIALVVTLGFTAWLIFSQEPIYESTATYIVRPTLSAEDAKSELSGLDVLGRQGDIASTFAEMANSRQSKAKAAERLGLSSSQRSGLSVDSQLVAGTYLLEITVHGPDPELIRDFANMVGTETVRFVEQLYAIYELVTLDPATAPSSPSKPNKILSLVLGAALGLVLGAGLAFLAYYLQSPVEAPASYAAAVEAAASDAEEMGEAVEALVEVPVETPRRIPVERRLVGWFAAAVLIVVLVVAASAIWLSGQGPSAASLPAETSMVPVALTATRTATTVALSTDTAMPTAVPTVTDTPEPSATPPTEPSATTVSSSTATATEGPTQTPASTPSPTPRPTEAAPAPTRSVAKSISLPALALLGPPHRQDFSADAEIVLAWQPVEELAADEYYAITVAYNHLGETWFDDVPWTRNTTWTLTEHSYLQDLSDNGEFIWSVQVVRQTGTDASGKPTGVPLSAPSEERMVTWRRESGGGSRGDGEATTPAPPPP